MLKSDDHSLDMLCGSSNNWSLCIIGLSLCLFVDFCGETDIYPHLAGPYRAITLMIQCNQSSLYPQNKHTHYYTKKSPGIG